MQISLGLHVGISHACKGFLMGLQVRVIYEGEEGYTVFMHNILHLVHFSLKVFEISTHMGESWKKDGFLKT